MKNQKLRKTVFAALFAAIICVATIVVQIPSPATNGFFNLGDCFVIIAGQLLGVGFGALAAGIGSCLADVFAGYVSFAPGTFVIKAVMGAVVALIYKALAKRTLCRKHRLRHRFGGHNGARIFRLRGADFEIRSRRSRQYSRQYRSGRCSDSPLSGGFGGAQKAKLIEKCNEEKI